MAREAAGVREYSDRSSRVSRDEPGRRRSSGVLTDEIDSCLERDRDCDRDCGREEAREELSSTEASSEGVYDRLRDGREGSEAR